MTGRRPYPTRFGGPQAITYALQASGGAGWEHSRSHIVYAMIAGPPSSSSGPGRRPFKAVARVRIPLGAQHRPA